MRNITDKNLASKSVVENVLTDGGPRRIVIVIPGIRTNADWVDHAVSQMQLMSADPLIFKKSADSRISTFQLVTRFGLYKIRNNIKDQITNLIIKNLDADQKTEISLLCHSLGTDIAADIVERIHYKFDHIILMGAVCSKKKLNLLSKSCHHITNIRGTLDQYPIIASLIRPDMYSPIGTFGCNNPNVNEIVWEYDHSSCTDWKSIAESVLPIIETKTRLNGKRERSFSYTYYTYSRYFIRTFSCIFLVFSIIYCFSSSYLYFVPAIMSLVVAAAALAQYFFPNKFQICKNK